MPRLLMYYTVLPTHGDIDTHCTTQSEQLFISFQGSYLDLFDHPNLQPVYGGVHYLEIE